MPKEAFNPFFSLGQPVPLVNSTFAFFVGKEVNPYNNGGKTKKKEKKGVIQNVGLYIGPEAPGHLLRE